MELEIGDGKVESAMRDADEIRVKRKALKAVLEKCQRALELLNETVSCGTMMRRRRKKMRRGRRCRLGAIRRPMSCAIFSSRELNVLAFLKRLIVLKRLCQFLNLLPYYVSRLAAEVGSTWDVVSENGVWESCEKDEEDYVLVRLEDILEGVACFVATYILSDEQMKDLNPNQLQDALRKIFSLKKKKKRKLQKSWEGSQVIYNVASWSATAIGIYQNPAIIGAASTAFWTSCRVISKLF